MSVSCEPVRGKDTGGGAAGDGQIGMAVSQPGALACGASPEARAVLLRGTVRSKRGASTRSAGRRQRVEPARRQEIAPWLVCPCHTRCPNWFWCVLRTCTRRGLCANDSTISRGSRSFGGDRDCGGSGNTHANEDATISCTRRCSALVRSTSRQPDNGKETLQVRQRKAYRHIPPAAGFFIFSWWKATNAETHHKRTCCAHRMDCAMIKTHPGA
eukprot:6183461-Pleurochrysis_carterae.AAC.7